MEIKTTIAAVLLILTLGFGSRNQGAAHHVQQDSIPYLHEIRENDILSIQNDLPHETLIIALKNGRAFTYERDDWDYEDFVPSTCKKVADAIRGMQKTFTKTEQPPEFSGGQEAWNKYLHEFCSHNARAIKRKGPAEIEVQFVVHLKGQVCDIVVLSNSGSRDLSPLAIHAIRNSSPWIPAVQNGRKVVSYKLQKVKLEL